MHVLKRFSPKPYKLYNTIKNYEWGTRNEAAFIPHVLGTRVEPDTPYAELWIGAHPKASSGIEIDGVRIPLTTVVEEYPVECLGEYVCKKFSKTFPFLLKILSAAHALSIQTHPNKPQARQLHAQDPKNYPDDNHKPEVTIALDSLVALAGFKPIRSIKINLARVPELGELIGQELMDTVLASGNPSAEEGMIKKMYEAVMQHAEDTERLTVCISKIQRRLAEQPTLSPEEEQFLEQYRLFGNDVGLFSFFFFNLVYLKSGEAIFTDAGTPHAYIKGTICECMANSDNVVRAGLLDIIRYDFAECPVMQAGAGNGETTYRTTAKEFEVSRLKKQKGFRQKCVSGDRPSVYLLIHGSLDVEWNSDGVNQSAHYTAGESFFVPASLSQYEISASREAELFVVVIP
jgi:mannose-6-phosphate isomerase